ncbi:MAG: PspC domain-containing protein, partial [Opitutaceae bacterium]|jgi:phage shock protein PspC (stress-responsive transcriptional regulator)
MNKVIAINLGGTAFQLEEGGYDSLRSYLETASARLQGNPDREEIMSDIEQAIGDKFRLHLGSHKTVVLASEIAAVIEEMGPIEGTPNAAGEPIAGDAQPRAEAGDPAHAGRTDGPTGLPKRLYRIKEGAMLAGVCNGLAAYVNVDPTLVRLAFILLTIIWGAGVLVYLVLAVVVPKARSPEEKAAACGEPFTAQEFIRRAKEGYYEAAKAFPDRQARREWKRKMREDVRGWRRAFCCESRARANECREKWCGRGAKDAEVPPGASVAMPLLSLLHGILAVLWTCAMISLLATGAVFGIVLSPIVPIWITVLVLILAYKLIVWPLKATRRACYYGYGHPRWAWSFVFLIDAIVWIAVAAVFLWLGLHYLPQLWEAFRNIPSVVHDAVHQIKQWWAEK